jgi:hypothetical protein
VRRDSRNRSPIREQTFHETHNLDWHTYHFEKHNRPMPWQRYRIDDLCWLGGRNFFYFGVHDHDSEHDTRRNSATGK